MKSVKVEAKTRAIKATWTRELVDDLYGYNIDIEKELTHVLKEEFRKQRVSNRKKSINKIFQNYEHTILFSYNLYDGSKCN